MPEQARGTRRARAGWTGLLLLAAALPFPACSATYNLGLLTLDSLIPGNGPGAPGVNAFNIVNLTGDSGSGGSALIPDFPVYSPVTLTNGQLTVVVGGVSSVIQLGSVGPGVFSTLASMRFPDTTQFDSATFTATLNTTSLSLSDGRTVVAGSTQISATILPSGSVVQPNKDFALITATAGDSLTITKTHSGNFAQGQVGATYTVTVANPVGGAATSGTVTVTETVPGGMTLVSMAGSGWTCPAGGSTCSRSDVLAGGASYPAITVTVNVAAGATSPQVNQVSVSGGGLATASTTDSTTIGAGTAITITTNPAGRSIVVDGITLTAPQSFSWSSGSSHSVDVPSPQGSGGTRYVFGSWSDAGAQSHNIVAPSVPTTYTANLNTQYLLTTSAAPVAGGAVAANPAGSSGYFDAGSSVQLTAVPAGTYSFTAYSGDLTGGNNPQTLVMSAPRSVTATFASIGTGPSVISVTPNGGSGATQTFTATYAAANGYQDLRWVQLLFAAAPNGGGQAYCFVHYDVQGNSFWVYGEGGFFIGPILPGAPTNRLQNSLCALNTSGSTVVGNGSTLTVNAALVFKSSAALKVYMRSTNVAGVDTDWVQRGTWNLTPAALGTMSLLPTSGSGSTRTFTLTYPDPPGFAGAAFGWVQFLIAAASDGGGQPFCFVHYDRGGNGLWMYSGDVGFFLGPITPGTASNALNSSACSINTAGATVTNTGGNLVVTVPVTMKAPMSGSKKTFQRTLDVLTRDTGWQQNGTWVIP